MVEKSGVEKSGVESCLDINTVQSTISKFYFQHTFSCGAIENPLLWLEEALASEPLTMEKVNAIIFGELDSVYSKSFLLCLALGLGISCLEGKLQAKQAIQ